jgi:hypothetical protein
MAGGAVFYAGGNITIATARSPAMADQRGGRDRLGREQRHHPDYRSSPNSAPTAWPSRHIGETAVDFALQNSLSPATRRPRPNCVSDAGDLHGWAPTCWAMPRVPDAEDIVAADPGSGRSPTTGAHRTHALLPGSPAIETAVQACGSVTTDQRLVARPQGTYCDIGAFEFAGFRRRRSPSTPADGQLRHRHRDRAGTISCPAPAT